MFLSLSQALRSKFQVVIPDRYLTSWVYLGKSWRRWREMSHSPAKGNKPSNCKNVVGVVTTEFLFYSYFSILTFKVLKRTAKER